MDLPQPTGSVFPVRPSLDHLLAMGDDEEDNESEEQEQKSGQVLAVDDNVVVESANDSSLRKPEDGDEQEIAVVQNDVDDDDPSEMTEPQQHQQQPDAQQSTGSAIQQQERSCTIKCGGKLVPSVDRESATSSELELRPPRTFQSNRTANCSRSIYIYHTQNLIRRCKTRIEDWQDSNATPSEI
uniref:Uncharacterized protein n=1 Tax=Anopheles atroparvus TaxID=41427 RepID=A0A182ITZ4_ANOAO